MTGDSLATRDDCERLDACWIAPREEESVLVILGVFLFPPLEESSSAFFPSSPHLLPPSLSTSFPPSKKNTTRSLASSLQRSYATTLSTSSAPNYFPHLSKASPASPAVSQARVAGATLRGRDRAPRTSMSDPETVFAASRASNGGSANTGPAQPLASAGNIDPRFGYAFKHHSMSDAASLRGSVAPGVHVFEGGPAVSTADVPSPARHSMAEPDFASAVRTRLS